MNVPGATQQTHHSARQVQASLAPQLVPPGAQPSQRLLPAMRRARQPPMATIPTPTAQTTVHPPQLAAPVDLNAPGAASHAPAVAGSHAGVRYLLQPRPAQGFPRQSGPSNHPAHCLRPAPAYTSIRCVNGRLMSSEWSSIVSTLAEDDSLTVLPRSRTDNLKGRGATLTKKPSRLMLLAAAPHGRRAAVVSISMAQSLPTTRASSRKDPNDGCRPSGFNRCASSRSRPRKCRARIGRKPKRGRCWAYPGAA
ncbi:hypothetical protein ABIB75_007732 [Bradyrhizobium sp. GM2.2]